MKIFDLLKLSLGNLWRRKGRTALTAVGVILGTCLIIIAISLGLAMNQQIEAMLQSWGDLTMITVNNYAWDTSSANTEPLEDTILANIKNYEHVVAVTPQYSSDKLQGSIKVGKNDRYSAYLYNCMGMYSDVLEPMGYELISGRFLTPEDAMNGKKIPVMVGENFAYQFEDTTKKWSSPKRQVYQGQTDARGNPIPPFVSIDKDKMILKLEYDYDPETQKTKTLDYQLVVVGVLKEDYSKNFYGGLVMNVDTLKALETAYAKVNKTGGGSVMISSDGRQITQKGYDTVYVKVDDMNHVPEVEAKIKELGYQTQSMTQQREEMQKQVGSIQNILLIMAVFAMFTAALNIVNTMAMSVTERTREIGVMKVLGCKLSRIRSMFIVEAATIGFIGGLIGILISLGISGVLNNFSAILAAIGLDGSIDLGSMFGMGYVTQVGEGGAISVIPVWLVLVGMTFAVGVGLVAGIFPANRAVKISALEAIRHE